MRGLSHFGRAVAGAAVLVFVASTGYAGSRIALGALDDTYVVNVVLGRVGQGVVEGTDVTVRGVKVGEVSRIELDDNLEAVATLELEPQHPVPDRARFSLDARTLLGEKEIAILVDGDPAQGPFHPVGTTIDDPARVVEFQEVLAELDELFRSVDTDDLATLVNDGIGAFDDQGTEIARSIDQGNRATDVGSRILDDQVAATADLALVAEALAPVGEEFNRMAREFEAGFPTLVDNQERTEVLLDDLGRFSRVLDATLRVDRADLDRMILEGDSVTRMLFAYSPEVGEVLSGIVSYTRKFSSDGFRAEGVQGQAARFQVFLDGVALEATLCAELPPQLANELEECPKGEDNPIEGTQGPIPGPPLIGELPPPPPIELPLPPDLVAPSVPGRSPIDVVVGTALTGVQAPVGDATDPALGGQG